MFWKLFGLVSVFILGIAVLTIIGLIIVEKVTYPKRLRKEKSRQVIKNIIKEYW